MTDTKKSLKRTLIGKVVSDKRAKTVTVLVERRVKHALYGKIVAKSSKYHAHDETGEFHLGDVIEITENSIDSKIKFDRKIDSRGHRRRLLERAPCAGCRCVEGLEGLAVRKNARPSWPYERVWGRRRRLRQLHCK